MRFSSKAVSVLLFMRNILIKRESFGGCMIRLEGYVKRVVYFFLCVLLAFLAGGVPTGAAESKTVRVAWYEDSYNITGDHGERSGYGYEFQQAIAGYTGWSYQYVRSGWSNCLVLLENGDIDLMSGISYTPERAEKMLFSDLPMGEEKYYLYANLKDCSVSPSDLQTLNGKRVGLLKDSVQEIQFHEWEAKHNVQMIPVYVDGWETAKQKITNREIDCLVSAQTPALPEIGMSAISVTGSSNIYFGINKERPDLKDGLDKAMSQLDSDNPFYADELNRRYLMSATAPMLYPEEKEWLAAHGPIRIGWLTHDYGISTGTAGSDAPKGIINDYVKYAEHALGNDTLSFTLMGFDTNVKEIEALKNGEIDMIFHFTQNPYVAELNQLALSSDVLNLNMMAVTAKDYFDENQPNQVAALKQGAFLNRAYISYNYPDWKIVDYDSWADVKKAVALGEVDCYIAEAGQLMREDKDARLHGIILTHPNTISFAVNRGDTTLLSILNKTLKAMPESMLTSALAMHESAERKVTVMDFIKDNLLAVSASALIAVILVLAVILSSLKKAIEAEAKAKEAAAETQEINKQLQDSHMALEKALKEAEAANAAKSAFLFNMSHDIRTPMNALLGYTKLIKQELTDTKLLDYERKMEQAGELLLSIINNVLDMARIESGKMELDENYCHAGEIMEGVYEVFDVEAKKKGVNFHKETHVDHEHILCDYTKVQEIFTNLVSNAIKYTPAGGTIRVVTKEVPCEKKGYVRYLTVVEDTGIGMARDYLPKVFDPFTRERNTTVSKVAGTGLGMAIVKKLVDMMDGTITVESRLGKGTKFTVTLTHAIADKAYYEKKENETKESQRKSFIKGKRILLAEDNDLNAEIATVLLEEMGLQVDRVEDGIQCVSEYERHPAGTYDLIFMDVQMPKMDGYQATRAIRQFADKRKSSIPIVAMTANAFEEDRKMALSMGMNEHIAKPIDMEKVEKVILNLVK